MLSKNNLYAVILAGGSGTRFWPMSRKLKPKQFLSMRGESSLLQDTIRRVLPRIPAKNIFIVTNRLYKQQILKQIRPFKISQRNLLFEPCGKNTAPAICWAAARIYQINPHAIMAVLPSDHLILNEKKFLDALTKAFRLAGENKLVTLGIVPSRPETGYGYLKTASRKGYLKVAKFTEKPTLSKARAFIKSKNYLWNSGMFIWKAKVILEEFQAYLPQVPRLFAGATAQPAVSRLWNKLPSISIDYGILEKSRKVVAVPAQGIGWSDLGSWESLSEILPKDRQGNIVEADGLLINSSRNLIWGGQKLIAAVGIKDLIIIDTPDALLICPKAVSQQVKLIVQSLQDLRRREL